MCVGHACECVDVHVEAKTGCQVPSSVMPYCLETGSFSSEKLTISTKLAGQSTLNICLSLIRGAGAPGRYNNAWLYIRMLGTRTQVFTLTEQVLLPTKLSPSLDIWPSVSHFFHIMSWRLRSHGNTHGLFYE